MTLLISRSIDLCQLHIPLFRTYSSSNTTYWRPSDGLQKVLRLLYEENCVQFPVIIVFSTICKMVRNMIFFQTPFQINLTTNPCLNVSMTYHIQKKSFSYLITYQLTQILLRNIDSSSVNGYSKTKEHFHSIQILLAHFRNMLICPLLTVVDGAIKITLITYAYHSIA